MFDVNVQYRNDVSHADLQSRGVVKGIGLSYVEGGEVQSTNGRLTMKLWTNQTTQSSG